MVDDLNQTGKMCDWPDVKAVDGAYSVLAKLSQCSDIYVATGAKDSSETDIVKAFTRVGLDRFIQGYFCQENVGVGKESSEFFPRILKKLNLPMKHITMVGDSYERDILPALAAGINAIWYCNKEDSRHDTRVTCIQSLFDLLTRSIEMDSVQDQ